MTFNSDPTYKKFVQERTFHDYELHRHPNPDALFRHLNAEQVRHLMQELQCQLLQEPARYLTVRIVATRTSVWATDHRYYRVRAVLEVCEARELRQVIFRTVYRDISRPWWRRPIDRAIAWFVREWRRAGT